MAWVAMVFRDLLVYSQEHGTDSDHLVSVATYELLVDRVSQGVFKSLVRQTPGAGLDEDLEVTLPEGYQGPMDYEALRNGVEKYYRLAFGQSGTGIRFGADTGVTLRDVSVAVPMSHSFETP